MASKAARGNLLVPPEAVKKFLSPRPPSRGPSRAVGAGSRPSSRGPSRAVEAGSRPSSRDPSRAVEAGSRPSSRGPSRAVEADSAGNIRVAVRIRPLSVREKSETGGSKCSVCCAGQAIEVLAAELDASAPAKTYNFDLTFPSEACQDAVFDAIGAPVVDDAIAAYNGCIFAYGQTGSGKTHSMVGDATSVVEKGLLPRACTRLFEKLEEKRRTEHNFEANVLASYLEIYNEKIYDLLSSGSRDDLRVQMHRKLGAIVPNLTECSMQTMADCKEMFDFGTKKRAVAATQMNAASSRSHAVFTVQVRMQYESDSGKTVTSQAKIHFVDLAGSERVKKTGATGERMKEGIGINQALSVLGRVISDLSSATGGKLLVPPFRESKLTLLLKDALMGNSRTAMLACVSPSVSNLEESVGTLEFASRCKMVATSAQKNTESREDLIGRLTGEKQHVEMQLREEMAKREELLRQLQGYLNKASEKDKLDREVLEQKRRIEEELKKLVGESNELARARDDAVAAVGVVTAEAAANAAKAAAAQNACKLPTASHPECKTKQQEKEALEAKLREIEAERRHREANQAEEDAKAKAARAYLEGEINAKSALERELAAERDALLALQETWTVNHKEAEEKADQEKEKRKVALSKLGVDILDLDEQDATVAPRLVNLHPDPSLEGCLVYYLPVGRTSAGSDAEKCRVKLTGLSIQPVVCTLENKDNSVVLVRRVDGGLVRVNGLLVASGGQELADGDRLAIGRDKIFQVRIPNARSSTDAKKESHFLKAMEELAAGTTVNPEWQTALESVSLTVKALCGQEAATKLMEQAKYATEHINAANEILSDTAQSFRDGVSSYELSVVFEMLKGLPEVCVAAYISGPGEDQGTLSSTWALETFINERLPMLWENRCLGDGDQQADIVSFFHQNGEVWYTIQLENSLMLDHSIHLRLADFEDIDKRIRPLFGDKLPALPVAGRFGILRERLGWWGMSHQVAETLQAYVKTMESCKMLGSFEHYGSRYDQVTAAAASPRQRSVSRAHSNSPVHRSASRSRLKDDSASPPSGRSPSTSALGFSHEVSSGIARARLALQSSASRSGLLTPRSGGALTPGGSAAQGRGRSPGGLAWPGRS